MKLFFYLITIFPRFVSKRHFVFSFLFSVSNCPNVIKWNSNIFFLILNGHLFTECLTFILFFKIKFKSKNMKYQIIIFFCTFKIIFQPISLNS